MFLAYWRDWKFVQDLTQGTLDTLIYDPQRNMLTFPEGIRICWGPSRVGSKGVQDRVWWSYSDPETGDIWVAKSDKDFTHWEERQRLLFVPSGSTNPSVVFDNDGRYIVVAEFLPAGSEQKEIWLYEPPYSGYGIRRIVDGQYPVLVRDIYGEIFLFYQAVDRNRILYRKSSEAFAVEHNFETSNNELFPRGFRIHHTERSPYHDIYKYLMFYRAGGEELPRYKMSHPIDVYTVGLDLYITDSWGRGISGVHVEIEGQSHVTNKNGLVTFYKLPYNTSIEIKLSHPFLGPGDTQYIFIPESAKGTHVTHSLFFTKPKPKENLGVRIGLKGIEWQGTIFELRRRVEKLSPYINLRVEWESMLIPAYMLVYSGNIYEPVYSLRHHNTGSNRREALVWQEKGQFADQDVTVDIYAEAKKRPGIMLRVSGSSSRETGYVGCYNYSNNYLEIHRYLNGASRSIATKEMTIDQNKWYTLRMQAIGDSLKLKIWEKDWEKDTEEPDTWDIETTDSAITSGYAGVFDFDADGTSYWANYSLNGELADFSYLVGDLVGNMPVGWTLQFGTASRWTTEIKSVEVWDIEAVPGTTVQLSGQTSQTNQEGLAPFYDLQGGSVQSYEITHPNYPEISTGAVLIPEGEFDFIPMKIYEKPWDGHALEEVKVHVDLDVNLVAINIEYRQPKESVSVSVGLTSILWVEVE